MTKTIGIYSGNFDPIHLGHLTFALQALEEAGLDLVYFVPDRIPSDHDPYEHYAHRIAMIKQAIKPYKKLKVMEIEDRNFSLSRTMPKLQKKLKNSKLVYLSGLDALSIETTPPNNYDLVVGLNRIEDENRLKSFKEGWPNSRIKIIYTFAPDVKSEVIRTELNNNVMSDGLLLSVRRYIRNNWLYISVN